MTQPFDRTGGFIELQQTSPTPTPYRTDHRRQFRQDSLQHGVEYQTVTASGFESEEEEDLGQSRLSQGLGLRHIHSLEETPPRIRRVPVGSKSSLTSPQLPSPASPPLPRNFSQDSTPYDIRNYPIWPEIPHRQTLPNDPFVTYNSFPEPQQDIGKQTGTSVNGIHRCPTHGDIVQSRWSWYSVIILILAVYSTAFALIFLVIALKRPRWREKIGTQGNMSFGTATLLSALFSKTVELSFATVFVALLGQKLSRRAFAYNSSTGGISLAEISMRSWIMQPGTLLTHWQALKYTIVSKLGVAALIAAIVAAFYTTAAEVLVAPKLKMGPWEPRTLGGRVAAMYADEGYLGQECQTPIPLSEETSVSDRSATCLQISYSGRALHDFQSYIANWTQHAQSGNLTMKSANFSGRPAPPAMLYDNTTVIGQWLQLSNITEDSMNAKRLVLNVSMVMPHANLFHAAREPSNHILQPEDFQGQGEYLIRAAVPSPSLNVLCVGLATEEVDLFFNNETRVAGLAAWPDVPIDLDNLFGFSVNGEDPPLFFKRPLMYNTVANDTSGYGSAEVYLLGASPDNIETNPYVLCSLKSQLYSHCTNKYHATQSGGELSVHCNDDPENVLPYFESVNSKGTAPQGAWDKNWEDVGTEWIRSFALNNGAFDGDAVSARLVTQMIPSFNNTTNQSYLNFDKPTIAEALAVLGGVTLLMSSSNSPFIHYWNYTDSDTIHNERPFQFFPAQVKYRDYASGPSQNWQIIFYLILLLAFVMDLYATMNLMYHFLKNGQVTDYTEPQNMFALALMSQPSSMLSGSCGAGPQGAALGAKWAVGVDDMDGMNGTNPHFYVSYRDPNEVSLGSVRQAKDRTTTFDTIKRISSSFTQPGRLSWNRMKPNWQYSQPGPIFSTNNRRSSMSSRWKTSRRMDQTMQGDMIQLRTSSSQTPIMQHYMRLSGFGEEHWK